MTTVWKDSNWVWAICAGKWVESIDAVVPDWKIVSMISGCWRWCRLVSGEILSSQLGEMFSKNGPFRGELLRHYWDAIISNVRADLL